MANYSSTYIIDITDGTLYDVQDLIAEGTLGGAAIVSAINSELGSTTWQGGSPSGASIVSSINSELGGTTWQAGAGDGDVVGPSSSVDSQIVLFDSTTGKLLKATSGSGIAKLTSGILSVVTAPSGTIVGTSDIQTLTNKRLTKRISTITSSSTPTPDVSALDELHITALAGTATFGIPTGTPQNSDKILFIIADDGTARTLIWNAIYREGVASLPATTEVGKTTYVGVRYNAAAAKWDVLASGTTT